MVKLQCRNLSFFEEVIYMNEDNLRRYKRKLLSVLLETADPMTYDEIDYKLQDIEVPSDFLKRMLESLESKNIICTEPHNGEKTYILTHFGRRRLTVIMQRKKVQKAAHRRKTAAGIVALVLVLGLLGWCIFFAGRGSTPVNPDTKEPDKTQTDSNYETITFTEEDIAKGSLILVNASNEYTQTPENLVSVSDNVKDVTVQSSSLMLDKDAAEALENLAAAYKEATGKTDIRVYSAYVSREKQAETYDNAVRDHDEEYAAENYQKAGFSDNETGYALSFVIYAADEDGDYSVSAFNGSDFQKWMNENTAKYGFILRFPDGKEGVTGFTAHKSFFRYVGPVHATYIAENNLTLEEYTEELKSSHLGAENALSVTVDGKDYGVYYASGLSVSVPKNAAYTVSGDNSVGFVVTYEKG